MCSVQTLVQVLMVWNIFLFVMFSLRFQEPLERVDGLVFGEWLLCLSCLVVPLLLD